MRPRQAVSRVSQGRQQLLSVRSCTAPPRPPSILVPVILWIETDYAPPVWLQLSIYLPVTLIASLGLLQPVKGAVVGVQWALRMHGFDENAPSEIPPV